MASCEAADRLPGGSGALVSALAVALVSALAVALAGALGAPGCSASGMGSSSLLGTEVDDKLPE